MQDGIYRHAWAHRHFCLVPVQGFYEPCYESGKATRWKIHRQDDEPFALAAIWDRWKSESGETVHSCSLLTVNADASPLMRRFHGPEDEKRSVVVVPPERRDDWLDAEDSAAAQALLTLFDPAGFTAEAAPRVARSITSR